MSEKLAFEPRSSVLSTANPTTGERFPKEAKVALTFPDMATAAKFINESSETNHSAVTVDDLSQVRQTPIGDYGQYDAFVSRPSLDTGEVTVTVRHFGQRDIGAHAILSNFVMGGIERTLSYHDTHVES